MTSLVFFLLLLHFRRRFPWKSGRLVLRRLRGLLPGGRWAMRAIYIDRIRPEINHTRIRHCRPSSKIRSWGDMLGLNSNNETYGNRLQRGYGSFWDRNEAKWLSNEGDWIFELGRQWRKRGMSISGRLRAIYIAHDAHLIHGESPRRRASTRRPEIPQNRRRIRRRKKKSGACAHALHQGDDVSMTSSSRQRARFFGVGSAWTRFEPGFGSVQL